MSRDLKFRVYIEAKKRFIYCDDSEENYLSTFCTAVWQIEKISGKKIPKDQFTGLRDKNGKEIYEGDIVLLSPEIEPGVEYCPAEWGEDRVLLRCSKLDIHPREWGYYDIRGNIYENLDLLNPELPARSTNTGGSFTAEKGFSRGEGE
jgi:YopX protein